MLVRLAIRGIVLFFLLGLMGCSSMMYYPNRFKYFEPAKWGLRAEDVDFKDQEGLPLHAWWFDSKVSPAKGTFVFFHGNAENLTSHFAALTWLPEQGYNFLIFDYPGYGLSEGEPSPRGNVLAGQAALQWVHKNKDSRPLVVYGQSMGGIVALRTVQELRGEVPIRAVIADGTFDSFQAIARKKLSQSWITWWMQPFSYLFLSDAWAPDVAAISPTPLLVMHGKLDNVVNFEFGESLFQKAREPKKMLISEEGAHGNLFWIQGGKFRTELLQFIESQVIYSQ